MLGDDSPQTDRDGLESMDGEELRLRKEVRDLRRVYFRTLRAEQSLGYHAAVRPRLSLESVDSFADEIILKLIEGMEGALECEAYLFSESRERDPGRKNFLRCLARVQSK
jgi:hypothetical protein